MKFQSTFVFALFAIGYTLAQTSGGTGSGINVPSASFLQGLPVSDISDFLSILNNGNLTQGEVLSELTDWAGRISSELQSEVSQWTSNLTGTVQEVLDQLDTVVGGLSSEAQSLFNVVRSILFNDTLTSNDQCANILSIFGNAPTNVLSELFNAVPVLGNLCGINLFGGLLPGLVSGLVAGLLGLVNGLLGGLLGGLTGTGLLGGVVGGVGGAVSGIVGSLGL